MDEKSTTLNDIYSREPLPIQMLSPTEKSKLIGTC
jgi:hypothetical protein